MSLGFVSCVKFDTKHLRSQRTYRIKHEYNNEDDSLNILSDKNYQTSSQKFRQSNNSCKCVKKHFLSLFCTEDKIPKMNNPHPVALQVWQFLRALMSLIFFFFLNINTEDICTISITLLNLSCKVNFKKINAHTQKRQSND